MPVINGHKMACDACIRGHRSTKCDHGDSRVLVKVRKPGRPLTACPHLQSQPCDCPKNPKGCGCSNTNSITVAFPKRQGCGDCKTGPKTIVKSEGRANGPAIPDVPAATAGTFKVVKKSALLAAAGSRGRPLSYDGGNSFDRMDLNNCNIIQNGSPATPAGTNGMSMNGMALPQAPVQIAPALPNLYTQNHSPPMPMPFYAGIMANGQTPRTSISNGAGMPFAASDSEVAGFSLSNGSFLNGNANYMSNGAYLVNGHAPQPILTSPYPISSLSTPQSYTSSMNGTTPATTVKSCCSSKKSVDSSQDDFSMNPSSQAPIQQSYNTPAFSNGNSPIYNGVGMQPAYTYSNNFGASPQQMQNEQWTQNFGMSYSSQQPLQQLQQFQNSGAMSSDAIFQLPTPALDANYEMQCACGSDCECLGCQMHPQNATTLAYVRNLNHQMSQLPSRQSESPITPAQAQDSFYMPQTQPSMFPPHLLQNMNVYNGLDKDPLVTTTAMKSETPESGSGMQSRRESPQVSVNGSPYTSMGGQQELDGDNYFWATYDLPGEGGCGGDLEGCQCGDDCQCVGCTIHQAMQESRQEEQDQVVGVEVKAENGFTGLNGTVTPEEVEVKKSCCGWTAP